MQIMDQRNSGASSAGRAGLLAAATLVAALAALPAASWAQAASGGSGDSRAGAVPAVPPPPVTSGGPDLPSVIVVPHDHRHDERLANGCWVRFHNDKSYRGRSLTLAGPVEMPRIHVPGGLWVKWSSVVVGPGATVTTYDFEQFKNPTAVLRPGQRIPDLRDRKLGLFEDIHSLRIACQR